jgi:hypothetical protein
MYVRSSPKNKNKQTPWTPPNSIPFLFRSLLCFASLFLSFFPSFLLLTGQSNRIESNQIKSNQIKSRSPHLGLKKKGKERKMNERIQKKNYKKKGEVKKE